METEKKPEELIGYTPILDSRSVILENIEQYRQKKPNFTEDQLQQIQAEKDFFGVSDTISDESFVKLHRQFCEDILNDLQSRLDGIKKEVVARISQYLASGDELESTKLKRMMDSRLQATIRIELLDGLCSENKKGKKASFRLPTRQIEITLSEILRILNSSQNPEDYAIELADHIIAHEVIHGVLAIETESNDFHSNFPVRNGVDLGSSSNATNGQRHGEWINEAMIESLRNELFNTGTVSYELPVIILEMLDQIDPGLRKAVVQVAISGDNPDEIFARIETILGPSGIDNIAKLLKEIKSISDVPLFNRKFLELLNEEFRDRARKILEEKENQYLKF